MADRRNMALYGYAAALGVLLLATPAPGHAQEDVDLRALQERSALLQRDVRALDRAVSAQESVLAQAPGVPPGSAAMARLDVRLAGLEDDVRTLTGRTEQLGYEVRQLSERVERVLSDLELRMHRLEEQAGIASDAPSGVSRMAGPGPQQSAEGVGDSFTGEAGGMAPAPDEAGAGAHPDPEGGVLARIPRSELEAGAAGLRRAMPEAPSQASPEASPEASQDGIPAAGMGGAAGMPEGTPQEQYAYAFQLLRASEYAEAEQALKTFLLRHPDHQLSDNARYWLGETFYVRGQYPQAAQQFVDAYQNNPSGSKSADALLKLGMSLSHLGKKDEACATFRELARTQPDAPETMRNKAAAEAQRTGCT